MALLSTASLHAQKKSDWNPTSYRNNSKPQYKAALNALSRLTLRGDEAVLDIGCGDGKITAHIASLVPNGSVHGIDVSSSMIDFAQKSFGNVPNLSFEHIDANSFSYDQELDVITSFACLHFVKDKQDVFRRALKALQPGGTLLVVITDGLKFIFPRIFNELFEQPDWKEYKKDMPSHHLVTKEELEQDLSKAGFSKFTVEETTTEVSFPTQQDLCNWLEALGKGRFPSEELGKKFAQEFADRYLEQVKLNEDGSVDVVFPRFLITATRL